MPAERKNVSRSMKSYNVKFVLSLVSVGREIDSDLYQTELIRDNLKKKRQGKYI